MERDWDGKGTPNSIGQIVVSALILNSSSSEFNKCYVVGSRCTE